MKLNYIICPTCVDQDAERKYVVKGFELRDDLVFAGACPAGHQIAIVYSNPKFEILFTMGAKALIDGYGREAVSSFAVAIERFHEFCTKVFCAHFEVSSKSYLSAWKFVSSQSERQLGAFYFLYLAHFKEEPPFEKKRVEFRNDITHKGSIPTLAAAADYGEYAFNYITSVLQKMKPAMDVKIQQRLTEDAAAVSAKIPEGTYQETHNMSTLIGMTDPTKFGKRSFGEALSKEKRYHVGELEDHLADLREEVVD